MYKVKKKSAWKVDGSVATALGFLAVSGGKGTISLKDPQENEVDFPYLYAGAGASVGLKYDKADKYASDDLSITLPFDLPNGGEIYILDSFGGDELKDEDISGMCLIAEISVGAVAVSGSLSGMLIGIPPRHFTKELAILGALQGGGTAAYDILASKIKILRSSAKAVLWLGGINAGLSLSAGITGSIGYIRQAEYKYINTPVIDIKSTEETSNPAIRQTQKDSSVALISKDVLFECGEAVLKQKALTELQKLLPKIRSYSNRSINILGYADNTENHKKTLSENRAKAVWGYFAGAGINVSKMKTSGRGADDPVAANSTKEGRDKNRRVEIYVMPN